MKLRIQSVSRIAKDINDFHDNINLVEVVKKSITNQVEISTITEYIKFIEETCHSEYYLFRGQSHDWPLLPKIARITPQKGIQILQAELKLISDFKRLARPFLISTPANEWEWLALAQHHGMATRLLDWTINPLAALWFAVNTPPKNEFGVVWAFDAPETDILTSKDVGVIKPFAIAKTKAFQPELSTIRIQAQYGWFTVHKYLDDKNKFIPFQTNAAYKSYLRKVIIPSKCFFKLRFQLDRLGVNRLSLFPDLEGAASHSEWMNCFLEDEYESILK